VTLVGMADAASTMPADASRLYAKNVINLLALMQREGELVVDLSDEVLAGACVVHEGVVLHEPTRQLIEEAGA
jgi:NAD(P) transhydrogenase subunit alpha